MSNQPEGMEKSTINGGSDLSKVVELLSTMIQEGSQANAEAVHLVGEAKLRTQTTAASVNVLKEFGRRLHLLVDIDS